ncbi:unnamed protein product [Urochloa humidicola]
MYKVSPASFLTIRNWHSPFFLYYSRCAVGKNHVNCVLVSLLNITTRVYWGARVIIYATEFFLCSYPILLEEQFMLAISKYNLTQTYGNT